MHKILLDIPNWIDTERLYLRPYQAGDGPLYFAAGERNQEHLAQYESGNVLNHLKDETHAEAIVRELAADWMARKCFFIGIFIKETDQWAGQVYVGPTNWDLPEFVIGYVADVDHEGQGYISEAVKAVVAMLFNAMGAHRVKADCNEENVRSWKLLERCGFRREGHLRQNKKSPDGSYLGDYLYAILRDEFFE